MSFANPDGRIDIVSMSAFLESVAPAELPMTLAALDADPTDVLTVGDFARMKGLAEHAILLFGWALDRLERDPSLIATDTNLPGGYYFFGKTLLQLRRPAEAVRPLRICTQLSPDDPTGWYLLGLSIRLSGDLEEALRCLRRALQLRPVDSLRDNEFFENVREAIDSTRREIVRRELQPAPEAFRVGFSLLGRDWARALQALSGVDARSEWDAAARCCRAYCLQQLGRHSDALAQLKGLAPSRMHSLWRWYWHHTAATSLNMLDDLPAAIGACDAAIEYFGDLRSDEDVAHFLSVKANILKQQAFRLSTNPNTYAAARPKIVAAIECLAKSVALQPTDGNELDEEWDGMSRIAARIGIGRAALTGCRLPARANALFDAHLR